LREGFTIRFFHLLRMLLLRLIPEFQNVLIYG
jgi:hypothetical protein